VRARILLLTVVTACASHVAPPPSVVRLESDAFELHRAAQRSGRRADFDRAIAAYENLLRAHPGSPHAFEVLFFDGEARSFEMLFETIGGELSSQYVLGYVPEKPQPAGFHRLQVEVVRPGLHVRHRPGYAVAKPR